MVNDDREDEIREKIEALKDEGRLKWNDKSSIRSKADSMDVAAASGSMVDKLRTANKSMQATTAADDYADKIGAKLGGKKSRLMGGVASAVSPSAKKVTKGEGGDVVAAKKPQLGKLEAALDFDDIDDDDDDDEEEFKNDGDENESSTEFEKAVAEAAVGAIGSLRSNVADVEDDRDDDDLADLVYEALSKKDFVSQREDVEYGVDASLDATKEPSTDGKTTSGIGGSWEKKDNDDADYTPSVGTWGVFARPDNISETYGGGKRVGAGVKTDKQKMQDSINETKAKLAAYKQKMGIDVQSEKDHADIIEEAIQISGYAMQRGSYSTGVSALEKVTQYCSTKSKVGGVVFLELAMAYEADGNTDKAIGLYSTLTKSPIDQVKNNASRLLYGLEAMNFMRNDAKLKEFSRKKITDTFVDATGFNDITKNFDDVYNTAYIDLDSKSSKYYKMLTESVVRSTREARMILLKATGKGEVPRMKIIQALRSMSRNFDDALAAEMERTKVEVIPVDFEGQPIAVMKKKSSGTDDMAAATGMDGFVLSESSQTLQNLDGEWTLQLLADRKGDKVNFFNSTVSWQVLDTTGMNYRSASEGFRSNSKSGSVTFDGKKRILSREGAKVVTSSSSGGGDFFSFLSGGGPDSNPAASAPQQILIVDSALMLTRAIVKVSAIDNVKDYFGVWRRTEPGTYSRK